MAMTALGVVVTVAAPGWVPDLPWIQAIRNNRTARQLLQIKTTTGWEPPTSPSEHSDAPFKVRARDLIERHSPPSTAE